MPARSPPRAFRRAGRCTEVGPLEEHELINAARQGDTGAYEELVRRHQQMAIRTAYLLSGGEAEAEDAAQEAFIKAYQALPRFRPGAPFRPWLLRIVANEARNRRRAAGRREALQIRQAARLEPECVAPSAEATALAAERDQMLLQALDALREGDRLVIACRFFLDLSEAEMAALLGCPRGTVKSRLARALGRLRILLSQAPGEWPGAGATEEVGTRG